MFLPASRKCVYLFFLLFTERRETCGTQRQACGDGLNLSLRREGQGNRLRASLSSRTKATAAVGSQDLSQPRDGFDPDTTRGRTQFLNRTHTSLLVSRQQERETPLTQEGPSSLSATELGQRRHPCVTKAGRDWGP